MRLPEVQYIRNLLKHFLKNTSSFEHAVAATAHPITLFNPHMKKIRLYYTFGSQLQTPTGAPPRSLIGCPVPRSTRSAVQFYDQIAYLPSLCGALAGIEG